MPLSIMYPTYTTNSRPVKSKKFWVGAFKLFIVELLYGRLLQASKFQSYDDEAAILHQY
jgi:hypothetical protein